MPNNRVLVVGESCNDIFIYGNASRLCPDVPAPVFTPKNSINTPGMAGNTARNLESLGFKVDFIQQQERIEKTRYIDSKNLMLVVPTAVILLELYMFIIFF